jgi:hypothetical protein
MRVVDGWAAGVVGTVGSLLCGQGSGAISIGGTRLARRRDSDECALLGSGITHNLGRVCLYPRDYVALIGVLHNILPPIGEECR